MKYYFVARTPNGRFVGAYTVEQIAAQLHAGEIREDFVCTESTGPSYGQLLKIGGAHWVTISQLLSSEPVASPEATPIAASHPLSRAGQIDLTADYLVYLQAHSACKGLRGSIAATFWFNTILWLVAGVGCIILLVGDKSTELDKTEAKIGLVIVFFAVNALIVYRQLAMMVVTLVDSIVIRNRDADGGYETQRQQHDGQRAQT